MDPRAMEPFGKALAAYFEGESEAELILRRDDGEEAAIPASHFFAASRTSARSRMDDPI